MLRLKTKLKFTDVLADELYKPVTRKLQRRRVNINGDDEIWAADLIDMQAFSKDNNGIKYLLRRIFKICLDCSFKTKNWTGSRRCVFEDLERAKAM